MGEFQTEGAELKKLVKIARTKSLAFAFCPAAGEEEPMFCLHRRKKPEILGKALRKESEQTKVAFGMATVEGKTLNMTCDRLVPGMSKKLKKFFRGQKLPLDVVVMDAEGQEVGG
ncbi:hypothetical protein EGN72_13345 [Pseudorhodobacter sp. E13]|uniref:hypothetical protein n=1 Tax=Pseudorhodobacter sp. E13 TaxID=2487931 RepID=UPI000F8D0017|nr:hypothetical protein [Pseudorhodobacter sp. E13]RUS59677.1 hypothetical protein EGN72_13345 [Pseudorhodobacter sp. E13]